MELLTEEDYKKINKLNKSLESDVKAVIAAANAFITSWLNFSTGPSYIEVNANRAKYFINPMATQIEGIFDLDGNIITGYRLLGDGVILFQNTPPAGTYKVVATETTFTDGIPDDVKLAVSLYVDYITKSDYRQSKTFGGETVQFTDKTTGIPTHIRSILELYRNY